MLYHFQYFTKVAIIKNNVESDAEISTNWLDTNSRTHIWEVIYNNENIKTFVSFW